MTDHPTPGSPLSADDVGLLPCPFCGSEDNTENAAQESPVRLVAFASPAGGTAVRVECSCGAKARAHREDWQARNAWNTRLPTDRRAEAETPPSAGPDAGLKTVAKLQSSDIFWTDAGLKLPLPAAGEEIEFVTRQSAAAALEATAEREGELRAHLTGMLDAYELLCQQSGMNYHESPSSKYAVARAYLSAIPTPERE